MKTTTNYLYLIKQDVNDDYDTYDSAVVCAKNASDARRIHPYGLIWDEEKCVWYELLDDVSIDYDSWYIDEWSQHIKDVTVTYLGVADTIIPTGIVCSSFNAV